MGHPHSRVIKGGAPGILIHMRHYQRALTPLLLLVRCHGPRFRVNWGEASLSAHPIGCSERRSQWPLKNEKH
jgi:hypothetical protein